MVTQGINLDFYLDKYDLYQSLSIKIKLLCSQKNNYGRKSNVNIF